MVAKHLVSQKPCAGHIRFFSSVSLLFCIPSPLLIPRGSFSVLVLLLFLVNVPRIRWEKYWSINDVCSKNIERYVVFYMLLFWQELHGNFFPLAIQDSLQNALYFIYYYILNKFLSHIDTITLFCIVCVIFIQNISWWILRKYIVHIFWENISIM